MANELKNYRFNAAHRSHYPQLLQQFFTLLGLLVISSSIHASVRVETITVDGSIIQEKTDRVTIKRGKDILSVAPGDELRPNDVLSTGPDSQVAIRLKDGAVEIFVLESSEIRVSSIRVSSIWLEIGEVFVRVRSALKGLFEVESEYGVAGVEGTIFAVRVGPREQSGVIYRCITLEGKVTVRSPNKFWPSVAIHAGQELEGKLGAVPNIRQQNDEELDELMQQYNEIERVHQWQAAKVLVPRLVGLGESFAIQTITNQKLKVGSIERIVTGAPVGQVLKQYPFAHDEVAPFTYVRLTVEDVSTNVPDLIGIKMQDALRMLEDAWLEQGTVSQVTTGEHPLGVVVNQQPRGGDTVALGSAVMLWIEVENLESTKPPKAPMPTFMIN